MSTYKAGELIPLIEAEAKRQGVDPALALAIFSAENSSDGVLRPDRQVSLTTQGITPGTGKPSGALGLFQVVPTTLRGLAKTGYIPPNLDYSTLTGQIQAGVAAVKEAAATSQRVVGKYDPLAAASQYVNGGAGLRGYIGTGEMPEQATGYLKKIGRTLGMTPTAGTSTAPASWGRENRQAAEIPPETRGAQLYAASSPEELTPPSGSSFGAELPRSLAMLQAMGIEGAGVAQQGRDAVSKSLEAATAEIQAAQQRSAQELQRDKNIQALMGLDPGNQSSQLIANLAAEAQARETANSLKPAIDQLMAINPMANPVKWIAAQFQLGGLVPQYNAAIQNRDKAMGEMSNKYALAQQAKTMTPAVTLDTIQKESIAKTKMAEAMAMVNSAKVDNENINFRARLLSEKMQWLGQEVAFSNAANRMAMEQLGIEKDKAAQKADQVRLDRINNIRLKYGAPPIATWKEFSALPKDQQEALINANPQASSPGEAIRNLITFGDVHALQRQPGNTAMADQAIAIREAVDPQVKAAMIKPGAKELDVYQSEINKQYRDWRTEVAGGDMTKASGGNPYRINVEQAARNPQLANNNMAKWATEAAKTMPAEAIKEKEILAYATAEVKNGKSVDAVAADVAEFFSKGYEYQFQARGLGTLGFDPRTYNKQIHYGVGSNVFGFFERAMGGKPAVERPIDLMNPTSVKQFLVETQIKTIQRQFGGPTNLASPNLMGQIENLQQQTGATQ
jgi:hypothetical protein